MAMSSLTIDDKQPYDEQEQELSRTPHGIVPCLQFFLLSTTMAVMNSEKVMSDLLWKL